MKIRQIFPGFLLLIFSAVFVFNLNSCTREGEVIELPELEFEYSKDIIKAADGWNFDKTHSSVRWETAYLGSSALLTGRFNSFSIELDFTGDKPDDISIVGRVTLSTVNTGEPGRDQGCLLGTFGTADNDEAVFTSTAVKFDNEGGYDVTGTLNFHGVTSESKMKLYYTGSTRFDENSGLNGAPFTVAGFTGQFEMSALTVFLIDTHNIADRVVVKINGQFKKPG